MATKHPNTLLYELNNSFPITVYDDPVFHQSVVDHFTHIRENPELFSIEGVTPLEAAIYKGDFHGLLGSKNIDHSLHNILTEFNGFTKSTDFHGLPMTIKKISAEFLETLKKGFITRRR